MGKFYFTSHLQGGGRAAIITKSATHTANSLSLWYHQKQVHIVSKIKKLTEKVCKHKGQVCVNKTTHTNHLNYVENSFM